MCKKRGENSLALTPFHEFILVYCGVVGLVGWGFGGMVALDGWKRIKSRLRRKKTAPRLFVHFHPTNPTIPPQKKEHSLLVLPSVNTIINFATEFFEMFTKLQSEHPQKVFQVFQVFRVFQVFHIRFWTTKPPDFGPNPN